MKPNSSLILLNALAQLGENETRLLKAEKTAILDHIRQLTNLAKAPYQCYWRDRAQKAEALLAAMLSDHPINPPSI